METGGLRAGKAAVKPDHEVLRLDDENLSPGVRDALALLDTDDSGEVDIEELLRAGHFIRACKEEPMTSAGEISLECFPDTIHEALRPFDPDGDGTISVGELVMAAQAMERIRKENRYMKIAIAIFIGVFFLFCCAIFGLTYVVVELTKEMQVDEDNPNLTVAGSDTVVQVASSEMTARGGTFRDRDSGGAVATDDVNSYAFLPDLLDMPLEVIDTMQQLTFTTVDGALHSYPKQGIRLSATNASDPATQTLMLYTANAGLSVRVTRDHAYLLEVNPEADSNNGLAAIVETQILLPAQDDVDRRRRNLLDAPGSDLHRRCHETHRFCLHTLNEVLHLHGHFEDDAGRFDVRRGLAAVSDSAAGVSYAQIKMDAYQITSNTGFVSWADAGGSDFIAAEDGDEYVEEELTYDEHGCIVEEGFETRSYPLTVKHCYRWRHTKHCDFRLDGSDSDPGYVLENYGETYEFNENDRDAQCRDEVKADSPGYCECGSGMKIRAGACAGASEDFTCLDVCLEKAREEDQMVIDFYEAHDERLEHLLNLDEIHTRDYFNIDEQLDGSFRGEVQDNVYFSMRLGYRRETPRFFGKEDWPGWLDYHANVKAHFTPESLSQDGSVWSDASRNGFDATVSGAALRRTTLSENGPEEDTVVVSGTTGSEVHFDDGMIAQSMFRLLERANYRECGQDCIDLSNEIAVYLNQTNDFTAWVEGAPRSDRVSENVFLGACQHAVIEHADCGKNFDAFYPDFEGLADELLAALDVVWEGMAANPPKVRERDGGVPAWEYCAGNGGECACDGVVRFAAGGANNASLAEDGFTFDGASWQESMPSGFSGEWSISKEEGFNGFVAHYYKTTTGVTCSADALVPSAMAAEYGAAGADEGKDLSTWTCMCKSTPAIVDLAKDELIRELLEYEVFTGNDTIVEERPSLFRELLFADWSTMKPFEAAASSLESSATLREMSRGSSAENPLHRVTSLGFGKGGGGSIEASCRCLKDGKLTYTAVGEVLSSSEAFDKCFASGLLGAAPSTASESEEALSGCGAGAYLSIGEHEDDPGVVSDLNTGEELAWTNYDGSTGTGVPKSTVVGASGEWQALRPVKPQHPITDHKDGRAKNWDWMANSCAQKGKRLCRFSEICPLGGPRKAPYGGAKFHYRDMWEPYVMDPPFYIGEAGKEYEPRRGRSMGNIYKPKTYDLTMKLYLYGTRSGWSSLFHMTDGRNYGHMNNRDPAVWIRPGTTIVHFRQGDSGNINNGCDPPQGLPTNTWVTLKFYARGHKAGVEMRRTDNNAYIGGCSYRPNRLPHGQRHVYLNGDRWYDPVNGKVKDVNFNPSPDFGAKNWVQTGLRSGGTCNKLTVYHSAYGGWMDSPQDRPWKNDYKCCDVDTPVEEMTTHSDGDGKPYTWFANSCAEKGARLCTFDELCPGGRPYTPPQGGRRHDGDMWEPIIDDDGTSRNWVQTGTRAGGMCNKLTAYHTAYGGWMDSTVSRRWKGKYTCCRDADMGDVKWHDDGAAKSWDQMRGLCEARGRDLCTFDDVCPQGGPNKPPAGGKQDYSDMWVPVIDNGKHEWAQVGDRSGGTCNKLSVYHSPYGRWMDSTLDVPYKRVYGCCPKKKEKPLPSVHADGQGKPWSWFQNSCASKGKRLCTFEEMCPNGGPYQNPVHPKPQYRDMWEPIIEEGGKGNWVQTGNRGGGRCNLLSFYHDPEIPRSWMTTGRNVPWKKTYSCCEAEEREHEMLGPFTDGRGRNWDWMSNSCKQKGAELCTFDQICPDGGPHRPPAGGRLDQYRDMWEPIREPGRVIEKLFIGEPGVEYGPQQNRQMQEVVVKTGSYDLTMQVYVTGTRSGWTSLFHMTSGGNWPSPTQRDPAIWLRPGTTRVHLRQGDSHNNNNGCDTGSVPLNTWLSFKVYARQTDPNWGTGGIEVRRVDNNAVVASCTYRPRRMPGGKRIVYLNGDPWYSPVNGKVKDVVFTNDPDPDKRNWVQTGRRNGGTCRLLTHFHTPYGRWMDSYQNTPWKGVYRCCRHTKTIAEPAPACCSYFDTSSQELSSDKVVVASEGQQAIAASSSGNIFTIEDADPARVSRKGRFTTLFHVARYAPNSSNKKRIFQSNHLDTENDMDWFDGFDDGKSGVANHYGDFVTEQDDVHGDGWVISTSTTFAYRSNFISRPLSQSERTEASLRAVDLAINPAESTLKSDFQIAEILVLETPRPLSSLQVEDIERVLFRRHMPLFVRGHYTTDGWHENADGNDGTWDDTGLYARHATTTGTFSLSDQGLGGMVVAGAAGSRISFPSSLLPSSDSEFTMLMVAQSSGALLSSQGDEALDSCLREASGSEWGVSACEEEKPVVEITASESGKPLVLCEVRVLTASSAQEYHLGNVVNVAVNRTVSMSSLSAGSFGAQIVDDNEGTCAASLASGERTFKLELEPGAQVKRVIVVTDAARGAAFRVKLNGAPLGTTVPASTESSIGSTRSYTMSHDTFSFAAGEDAHRYSVYLEMGEGSPRNRFLEVCEVEVFGQPTDFPVGGADNPNVALGRAVSSTKLAEPREGEDAPEGPQALVDGDELTCARTQVGTKGAFRVDLDPGSVPTHVKVVGRIWGAPFGNETYEGNADIEFGPLGALPLSCEEQTAGLAGATLRIGAGDARIETLPVALKAACGSPWHARSTKEDAAAQYLQIDLAPSEVCEVQLFAEDGVGGEVEVQLSGNAAFFGTAPKTDSDAAAMVDGNTECGERSPKGGKLRVHIPYPTVPTRVVVHTDTTAEVVGAKVTLGSGPELGTFLSSAIDGDTITLTVPDVTRNIVRAGVDRRASVLRSDVSSFCGVAGAKRGAGAAIETAEESTPCDCEALCDSNANCRAWSYVRSPSHENYRTCTISAAAVNLGAAAAAALVSGVKDTSTAGNRVVTATSSEPFQLAELVVFDAYLPEHVLSAVQDHAELRYYNLLRGDDAPLPTITVHAGFTVESNGVQWAFGQDTDWDQKNKNHDPLTDDQRYAYGLSPLTYAVSGTNTYITSEYLRQGCFKQSSDLNTVTKWAFDPVRTSAYMGNVRRPEDSYGVELETLTICRRMQTATSALRNLPDSTVCGLLNMDDENPTCQPTALEATWTVTGVTFRWKPGCRAATKYQVVRDREEQIGQDFEKESTDPYDHVSQTQKEEFCLHNWIEPGLQLLDFSSELLARVGQEVEYCVRSLVPLKEGGIVASDWMCTELKIGWSSELEVEVAAERGGAPLAGLLVDGYLCAVGDVQCGQMEGHNAWKHHIHDGGGMFSFSTYSGSESLIAHDEDLVGACKYEADKEVVDDKPDFVMLLDGGVGFAWYALAPGCFLKISNFAAGGAEDGGVSFKVDATGGVQQMGGFLGFAYHFRAERYPSWHFMAQYCRETCKLTGREKATEKDVFLRAYAGDIYEPAFCTGFAARCPQGISGLPQEAGAMIFGQDKPEASDVLCSPHKNEWAYWASDVGGYRCCEGFRPTEWDDCERHYTVCDDSMPVQSPPTPKRRVRVMLESAVPMYDDAQLTQSIPWVTFDFGDDEVASPVEVLLVDAVAAGTADEKALASADVRVANAWSGPRHDYFTGRTDEAGAVTFLLSDTFDGSASTVREAHLLPFAASEFSKPMEDNVEMINTTMHHFKLRTMSKEKEDLTVSLHHRETAVSPVIDLTAVLVTVHVTHEAAGNGRECGQNDILMCAFSVDGLDTIYSCELTNELGEARLSVPAGVEAKVRNGCPYEGKDHVPDCDVEGDVRKGREVHNYRNEYGVDDDTRYFRISSAEALRGDHLYFVEHVSRYLDVKLGAGRYDVGAGTEEEALLTVKPVSVPVLFNTEFVLTHKGGRPGCSFTVESSEAISAQGSRNLKMGVPTDLAYDVTINISDADDLLPGERDVRTYMNLIPAQEFSDEEEDPVAIFMYRKKADLTAVFNVKDVDAPIASCVRSDGSTLHGVSGASSAGTPNQLEFTIAAVESYNATRGDAGADFNLLYVPGEMTTEDNLAHSTESRQKVTSGSGLLGSGSEALTRCDSPVGCQVSPAQSRECGVDSADECQVASIELEGTLYQMRVTQMGSPERYIPHTKTVRYMFTPAITDLPSQAHVELLTTEFERVDIVVEGSVPLTANQAIKLPEYVPFLILRDPPGDASTTTWSRGSSVSVGISVSLSDGTGNVHQIDGSVGYEFSTRSEVGAIVAPMGAGAKYGMEMDTVKAQIEGHVGGDIANAEEKVYSHGSSLTLTAGMSISTSGDYTGDYSDVLVTPSLAIRTITEIPIVFIDNDDDPSLCRGLAQNVKSTWQILDGSAATIEGLLGEYDEDADEVAGDIEDADYAATLKTEDGRTDMHNYAQDAIGDSTWNALTVHTVYDVISQRIPQLQRRCFEEWNSLRCNWNAPDSFFDGIVSRFDMYRAAPSVRNWCNIERNGPVGNGCDAVADPDTGDTIELAKARLEATLDGIRGWKRALKLNENLKNVAEKVSTGELVQTSLTDRMQAAGASSMAALAAKQGDMDTAASSAGRTTETDNFESTYSGDASTGADASIVAFSGGGVETTYTYTSTTSYTLALTFHSGGDYAVNAGAKGGGNVLGADLEFGYEYSRQWNDGKDRNGEQEREQETVVEFTLADDDALDMFDVMVKRDPVYGTPVFDVVAGRSMCPHEKGTDPREQWAMIIRPDVNDLDEDGYNLNKNYRNVVRPVGSDLGSAASFVVEVINESPYSDNLRLFAEIDAPSDSDVDGYDYMGVYGFHVEGEFMTEQGTYLMPVLYAGKRQRWRVDLVPSSDDERDFEIRRQRFAAEGKTDAAGRPHPGDLYCNVKFKLHSACEYDYDEASFAKGYRKTADETLDMCDAKDPIGARTFPESNVCWNDELPEIFDSDEGLMYAKEAPLSRYVFLPCISFNTTSNLCEPTDGLGDPCRPA